MLNDGGYVYLLDENGDGEMFKIGVTRSEDIQKRIKKLQTGNGNEIRLIDKFYSSKPFKLEKMLHNRFSTDRESGEWFLMSRGDVDNFLKICEGYEKIIESLKNNPFFD